MTLPRTVSDVVAEHTVFQIECIERMYLNVYVPQLQYPAGIVGYVHRQLGLPIASTAPLGKITDAFSTANRRFAFDEQVPWVDFAKGSARARNGRSALLRRTAERRRRARHLRPAHPRGHRIDGRRRRRLQLLPVRAHRGRQGRRTGRQGDDRHPAGHL